MIESMPLDQQQKFIVGLMDNPEHKVPDADGRTHIQKTFERLTLAKQQELLQLYKDHQAGAVVPRPEYADDTPKPPAVTAENIRPIAPAPGTEDAVMQAFLRGRQGRAGNPTQPSAPPAVPANVMQSGLHWYPKS
jgi:hypothetical protein